jgi:hypothetical protein
MKILTILFVIVILTLMLPTAVGAQYYNSYNYNNCTYHAYRLCVNNANLYWYDSCGNQQDLYSVCTNGQVCNNQTQYGQCAPYYINPVLPPVQPVYNPYFSKACFGGSVHWFDSLGAESGLYKNCNDNNSCTADTCSTSTCINTPIIGCGVLPPQPPIQPVQPVQPIQPAQPAITQLSIAFFAKQDSASIQWQKTADIVSDSNIYFMIAVANSSTVQIDNAKVSVNIPTEISSLGNLKIDNVQVSGDIVSGINIGSLSPSSSKSITFEGRSGSLSGDITTKQASSTISITGNTTFTPLSDTVSLTFDPVIQAAVAALDTKVTSGFEDFLKHWYLWIIVTLVVIAIFIAVFKRFSAEV